MNTYQVKVLKQAVRKRDGFRCTKCGMSNQEHRATYGASLDVHRTDPGSVYNEAGCVTLCKRCHGPEPRSPRGTYPKGLFLSVMVSEDHRDALRLESALTGETMARLVEQMIEKTCAESLRQIRERRGRSPKDAAE